MTKLEFSTSPTQDQFGGQLLPPRNGGLQKSCQLSGTSRTGRLPSLEKVSRDPVEYDCYGLPNSGKIGKEWPMYRLNVELVLSLPNKRSVCR